jgi:4-amino-4-deoxy-L-arabinose transferase-like glycosyltransferase
LAENYPDPTKIEQEGLASTPAEKSGTLTVYWLLLGLVILFIAFVRIRLLSTPLERDEGEYAYMGQLLLEGYAPFAKAYNMKLPGTSMMYALSMSIFGQTTVGVHLGFLLVNVGTILMLFVGIRRLFNPLTAFVASSTFALLTLSPALLGLAAHATHFVVFYAVAGLLVLQRALTREKKTLLLFASGLLLGASVLMKQPGAAFALIALLAVTYHRGLVARVSLLETLKSVSAVAIGVLVPLLLLLAWLHSAGVFDRFWFWTFEYGSQYASAVGWYEGKMYLESFFRSTFGQNGGLWSFAIAGALTLGFSGFESHRKVFVIAIVLISFLAVCPGFYFREHYFVLFAPAVGLLAGIGADFIRNRIVAGWSTGWPSWLAVGMFMIASAAGVVRLRSYYLEYSPEEVANKRYRGNAFTESVRVADYIRQHTNKEDRIAVLGSEPQIYFYADRLSATGYIYTYSLMEPQPYNGRMQAEMIEEIEASKPEMVALCRFPFSWLASSEAPQTIFEWSDRYIRANYFLVGVVEVARVDAEAAYFWDEEARRHRPGSDRVIFVFKRHNGGA